MQFASNAPFYIDYYTQISNCSTHQQFHLLRPLKQSTICEITFITLSSFQRRLFFLVSGLGGVWPSMNCAHLLWNSIR